MPTTINKPTRTAPHGTEEWAASNVNIQDGCEHDCCYCYAKTMAIRFKRATPASWARPRIRAHSLEKGFTKRGGRIMFPTAHDITEKNLDACLTILQRMLAAGNDLLIVSKPRLSCTRRLCSALAPYTDQIVLRFSIGSTDDAILKRWEPGAPPYKERLAALRHAHRQGYQTSVSCEPMLDGNIDRVIKAVRPSVTDSIWLGKINRLNSILPMNCPGDRDIMTHADGLTATQTDEAIRGLYSRYKDDPVIKWKDSIKAVVGMKRPSVTGLDI